MDLGKFLFFHTFPKLCLQTKLLRDPKLDCPFIKGGAKWCTGPKTKRCYSYQLVDDTWIHATDLIKARVYAGTTTMPGGTLWIMGGVGMKSVLRSSEIVHFKNEKWTVKKGPKLPEAMIGHCLTALGPFFLQN